MEARDGHRHCRLSQRSAESSSPCSTPLNVPMPVTVPSCWQPIYFSLSYLRELIVHVLHVRTGMGNLSSQPPWLAKADPSSFGFAGELPSFSFPLARVLNGGALQQSAQWMALNSATVMPLCRSPSNSARTRSAWLLALVWLAWTR